MQETKGEDGVCTSCHFDEHSMKRYPDALPPLTVIGGRYILGRVLGRGGFGITYVGWDQTLERRVAVKELFMSRYSERKADLSVAAVSGKKEVLVLGNEAFLSEAQTLASLGRDNPGIVMVLDHFQENGTGYIVMECLEGHTLRAETSERGGLTQQEVLKILSPVIEALEKVHLAGIIHKDISPDNIFVQKSGPAKLIDFGSAEAEYSIARSSLNSGGGNSGYSTYRKGYTAPEQLRKDGIIGPWTDIYSLSATIYFCLTQKAPYEGTQPPEEIHLPQEVKVSGSFRKALEKGLLADWHERYQDATVFLGELRGISDGEIVQKKKRKSVISITAGAVAAGALVVIFSNTELRNTILKPIRRLVTRSYRKETEYSGAPESISEEGEARTDAWSGSGGNGSGATGLPAAGGTSGGSPDSGSGLAADALSESDTEIPAGMETLQESLTESEALSETGTESGLMTEAGFLMPAETVTETEAATETETETETEAATETEAETETEVATETEAETETEAATGSGDRKRSGHGDRSSDRNRGERIGNGNRTGTGSPRGGEEASYRSGRRDRSRDRGRRRKAAAGLRECPEAA